MKKLLIIVTTGNGYGDMHFLSDVLKAHYSDFIDIWEVVQGTGEK